MAGFIGPVLTGGISGALLTIVRPEFFAITFLFAALYGLLVSGFATLFGINRQRPVNKTRLLASSALASAVTGGLSSLTSLVLGVVILNASMIVAIMAAGIVEGTLGGYLASVIWERGLGQLLDERMN
jgi:hypothetical protein